MFVAAGCSDSGGSAARVADASDQKSGTSSSTSHESVADAGRLDAGAGFKCSDAVYAPVFNDDRYDYAKRYIDVDEWRDTPVRHRYVHGGIEDTDLRFTMYFPPKEQYQGRFYHYILPVSGNEHAIEFPEYPDPSYTIGFAVDSGAYLVESNMGKLDFLPSNDPDITLYKGSAITAEISRLIANDMYCPHRPYGYAWGGSGGAFKTIACMEKTSGVWDGAVPFIHATPVALPNNFTVQAHALRILKDELPDIIDAVEPGGSGDMYAGLNDTQRDALLEVTKFGFPPRSWPNYKNIAFGYTGVLSSLLDVVISLDPTYFHDDFWTLPGYLGYDRPESFQGQRITNFQTSIAKTLSVDELRSMGIPVSYSASQPANTAIPAAFRLAKMPTEDLQGTSITISSGGASGSTVYIAGVFGDVVSIGYGSNLGSLMNVATGDQVTLDNAVYLAVQTYHRHQTAPPEYHVYDQYRDRNSQPIYPQRQVQVGTLFNQAGDMSGKFDGKMIVVDNLMDEIAFAWPGDWYRSRVEAAHGSVDDVYRLYYVDHAMHTPPVVGPNDERPVLSTYVINYGPVLQQALRDLAAWVENGVAPAESSAYQIVDGQVQVPATAAERKGLQPVVSAAANGGKRADVTVGEEVKLSAIADTPPNSGSVVAVEWDFEGAGDFSGVQKLDDTRSTHLELETTHAFSKPGTYFPSVRVSSQRNGNADTPHARMPNLDRVRVVVKEK